VNSYLAPLRLSLAGGGTDVPPFSEEFGSHVINFAIQKYVNISIKPKKEDGDTPLKLTLKSHQNQTQDRDSFVKKLERSLNQYVALERAIEIEVLNPVKPSSGLGTSSSMIVSILKALDDYFDRNSNLLELVSEAIRIERNEMGILGGFQDYFPAIYGGLNSIKYSTSDKWSISRVKISEQVRMFLEESIFAFELGIKRNSQLVVKDQIKRASIHKSETQSALMEQLQTATALLGALRDGKIDDVMDLVENSYLQKKKFSPLITNEYIDDIELKLRAKGARGIKVSGAGGGGHMFCFFPSGIPKNLIQELPKNISVLSVKLDQEGFRKLS
jgi:D-glycero-alpha-D-manno-heptose-7-phosphate kinase